MLSYTGTKTLSASPMTRGEYNRYRGWTIPGDENPNDQGMLVEYPDSPSPNHPWHLCHISWSPKDVFDRTYSLDTPAAPAPADSFIDRMKIEVDELQLKLTKLHTYINTASTTFAGLGVRDRALLVEQEQVMGHYLIILMQRLRAAETAATTKH